MLRSRVHFKQATGPTIAKRSAQDPPYSGAGRVLSETPAGGRDIDDLLRQRVR